MAEGGEPRIGDLRWQGTLCLRTQAPDPNGSGIVETVTPVATVHMDIRPIGMAAFIGQEEVGESIVTHMIWLRWRDYGDANLFNVIQRPVTLPDGTTRRTETFRLRRVAEWQGRRRWLRCEAELERFSE